MAVKEGYKQTEVGVIPEGWKLSFTNEIAISVSSGKSNTQTHADGRYPIYGSRGVIGFSTKSDYDGKRILVARVGAYAGTVYRVNHKYCVSDNTLMVKVGNIVDFDFLYYYLKYIDLNKLVFGSGQPLITGTQLKTFKIPIPPLPEQKAIATALSDIDGLIDSLSKLIEKKKNIKQGAMQELLTGKKRLDGFSGEWVEIMLEEVGKITGAGVDKKIVAGQNPVLLLNYLDVYKKLFIYRHNLKQVVTANQEKQKKCDIQKNDIFFTPTSEVPDDIAKSSIAMEDIEGAVYSYHVVRLRSNSGHDCMFLNYAFKSIHFINQTNTSSEGSGTRYVITLKKFRDFTILIPKEKEEQTAIATILADMDSEIEKLQSKLDKYKAIKQGMMQELLTGRIRLLEGA
jgi:type I restriction enzyme, S subunit